MKKLLQLFTVIVIFGIPSKSFGQLNIWKLDSAMWNIYRDTIVVVEPRFELKADTTFNFYEFQKGKKKIVLTLIYKHGTNYLYGCFKGTKKIAYQGYYLEPNFRITKDLDLSQMADSIVRDSLSTQYFVNYRSLGITEQMLESLGYSIPYEDYFKIAEQENEDKTICIYSVTSWTEMEPPYTQITITTKRTSR